MKNQVVQTAVSLTAEGTTTRRACDMCIYVFHRLKDYRTAGTQSNDDFATSMVWLVRSAVKLNGQHSLLWSVGIVLTRYRKETNVIETTIGTAERL